MPLDPSKVKVTSAFNSPATFLGLALDAAGGRAFAGADDGSVQVFDPAAAKKEPLARWPKHDNYISALAWVSRGGKPLLVSGSYDRSLVWWDPAAGRPVRTVPAHDGWVRDLLVTPDGGQLVSAGDDMLVKLWDTDTGRLVRTFPGHDPKTPQGHVTALYCLALTADGKTLASGDRHGTVIVRDLATGTVLQRFSVPTLYTYDVRQRKRSIGGIRALAFSPDGSVLAAGGIGQVENVDGLGGPAHVELWDWRSPRPIGTAGAQGHKGIINSLVFHPDGWLLGGGGGTDGGLLAVWKTTPLPDPKKGIKDAFPVTRVKTDGHLHRIRLKPGNELVSAGYHKVEVWAIPG